MFCKNCGKKLNDSDRFCSNCGTRTDYEMDENFVFTAPERDFEWNVHSFPDNTVRKTEDTAFDWGIEEGEFRSWPEPAPEQKRKKLSSPVIAPVPGSAEAIKEAEASQKEQAAEESSAPETPATEESFVPEASAVEEKVVTEESESEKVSVPEAPVAEEIVSPEVSANEETDQAEVKDLPVFEEKPVEKSEETAQDEVQQDAARTISNVKLEPIDDAEEKIQTEKKPKKKKGFFARFSKDKDSTLEQPVITDDQIRQARTEAENNAEPETKEEFVPVSEEKDAAEEPVAEYKTEQVVTEEQTDTQEIIEETAGQEESETNEAAIEEPEIEKSDEETDAFKPQHIEFDWSQPVNEQEENAEPEETTEPEEKAPEKTQDLNWAMTMDPREDFLAMQERHEPEVEPEVAELFKDSFPDAESAEEFGVNELKEEHEDDITGKELEQELFGGAAVAGVVDGGEGLSRQSAKIDQFYKFNKKNEEFQKLLDKEYEKFREGRPLDEDTFNANVEAIKAETTGIGMMEKGDTIDVHQMEEINEAIMSSPMAERKTMPYRVIDEYSEDFNIPDEEDEKAETPVSDTGYDSSGFIKVEAPEEIVPESSEGIVSEASEDITPEEPKEDIQQPSFDLGAMISNEDQQAPVQQEIPAVEEPVIRENEGVEEPAAEESVDKEKPLQFNNPESEEPAEIVDHVINEEHEYSEEEQKNIEKIREIFGLADENGADTAVNAQAGLAASELTEDVIDAVGGVQAAAGAVDNDNKESKGEKSGTAGKVVIAILSVILALLVAALGIKIFAPDSSFALKIDEAADKVVTFFTGEDQQPQEERADAKQFNADFNGIIQNSLDQNYNGYIEEIAYDSNLGYEKKTKNIRIKS